MFNVLDIYFKDVHAVVEHNRDDLEKLRLFLDECKIDYNATEDPKLAESVKYVTEKFFPDLEKLLKTLNSEQP